MVPNCRYLRGSHFANSVNQRTFAFVVTRVMLGRKNVMNCVCKLPGMGKQTEQRGHNLFWHVTEGATSYLIDLLVWSHVFWVNSPSRFSQLWIWPLNPFIECLVPGNNNYKCEPLIWLHFAERLYIALQTRAATKICDSRTWRTLDACTYVHTCIYLPKSRNRC